MDKDNKRTGLMITSKFSEEIIAAILIKYRNCEKVVNLCKEYGLSRSYFYKLLEENKPHYNKYQKTDISLKEVHKLRMLVSTLQTENEIFRKSNCCLNSSNDEKIEAVDRLKDEYTVHVICKTLGLLRSTYYHRVKRAPKQKWYEIRREELKPKILEIFNESKERFGSEKIAVKLRQEGMKISYGIVAKLMKEMGLVCKQSQKRYNTTNKYVKYRKNRLRRNFDQDNPNTFWVSDITYLMTKKEECYICTVIDLFSRKVIAYEVSSKIDAKLVIATFIKAFNERVYPQNLTFHSDQGSQYASSEFGKLLRKEKVKQSFSTPGTPYDNAVAEAFFSLMKRESLSHKLYEDIDELKIDVDEYINFFNNARPFRKLGNITPSEYEKRYFEKKSEDTIDDYIPY